MNRKRHWLRFEALESRCLLSVAPLAVASVAVDIPDNLTGSPGGHVIAPVNIDNAQGIIAAEIHIKYDTTWLDALDTVSPDTTSASIHAGSVWPTTNTTVFSNVDDAAGTIDVWVYNVDSLPAGATGSLINIDFTVPTGSPVGNTAYLDLRSVILNEGEITVDPAPAPWPDGTSFPPPPDPPYATDGLVTIINAPPVIASLSDSPDPVTRGSDVTLTANGVSDSDGTVVSVAFYRETNGTAGLQVGTGGDTLVATDTNGADGWSASVSTSGLALGSFTYYAQATDNDGNPSADGTSAASTTNTVVGAIPVIASLSDSPDPVTRGSDVTLTANGVSDSDGTVVSVAFYRETNGTAGLQVGTGGDTLVATDTNGADGWSASVSTSGLALGSFTYYAQATDNDGNPSADGTSAASTTNTVVGAIPVIASLSDSPDPVTRGSDVTLTANGVSDSDGTVVSVAFYRETNGTAGLQVGTGGDTLVATDTNGADGWSASVSTSGLALGSFTYYAQATDNDGNPSADGTSAASTTNTVVGANTSAVSGFVYADTNRNNKADANEGVPGVKITLTNTSTGDKQDAWTDDNGWYEFRDVSAGTYQTCRTPAGSPA